MTQRLLKVRLPGKTAVAGVPPRNRRRKGEGPQHVGERVRRVIRVELVSGDPPQPAGQPEYRLPVPERRGLGQDPEGLPPRTQPGDRSCRVCQAETSSSSASTTLENVNPTGFGPPRRSGASGRD